MGTQPSSARKVARVAAKSGGKTSNKQRNWLFPAAIVAIVVLGLALLVFARSTTDPGGNTTPPRANLNDGKPADHWHTAFSIQVCGKALNPVQDPTTDDIEGIHTHGDGLIHVHPFVTRAGGKGATLGRFFKRVGIKVTSKGIQMPNDTYLPNKGRVLEDGVSTCDGKPAELRAYVWEKSITAKVGNQDRIVTGAAINDIRFDRNYMAITLAFDTKDAKVQPPSTSEDLKTLGECDGANPPPECQTGAGAAGTGAVTVPPGSGTGSGTGG